MEKGRFALILVVCATFFGPAVVAHGDEPTPTPTPHHARKKRSPKAPKVSDRCAADADCELTAYADGACCPMLCQPRAVSKTSAEAIAKFAASCSKQRKCPAVDCAPPRMTAEAACVSGKCVARPAPGSMRE